MSDGRGIINQKCKKECDNWKILKQILTSIAMYEATHTAYKSGEKIPLLNVCPYCGANMIFDNT